MKKWMKEQGLQKGFVKKHMIWAVLMAGLLCLSCKKDKQAMSTQELLAQREAALKNEQDDSYDAGAEISGIWILQDWRALHPFLGKDLSDGYSYCMYVDEGSKRVEIHLLKSLFKAKNAYLCQIDSLESLAKVKQDNPWERRIKTWRLILSCQGDKRTAVISQEKHKSYYRYINFEDSTAFDTSTTGARDGVFSLSYKTIQECLEGLEDTYISDKAMENIHYD